MFDLQVKARCKYVNWTLNRRHETIISSQLFYCLLAFRSGPDEVSCWIVPSRIVADCVRETHESYRAQTGKDGSRRHVREDMSKRHDKYALGWLEPYRDKWALLPRAV